MGKNKVRFPVKFQCGFSQAQSEFLEDLVRSGRFEGLRAAVRWCVSRAMTYEPKSALSDVFDKGAKP